MANYQNYEVEQYECLRQIYHANARKLGNKTFCLQKRGSDFEAISFQKYASDVDALGTRLLGCGLGGATVVMGENCYEWIVSYMAVICGVGVVVPVDRELSAEELANVVLRSGATAVICSSSCAQKTEGLSEAVRVILFEELRGLIGDGEKMIAAGNRSFLDAPLDPLAMSALIFTSGTTNGSKGVMLSHRNLCFTLSEVCRMVYIGERDVFLSTLPLHHVYESTCGFLCPLYRGASLAFGGGLRHITRDMQSVRPTVMLCVPLLIETMYQKIWSNISKQELEKSVQRAISVTNALPNDKMRITVKKGVFAEIHKSFGGRLRLLISGGASVDSRVIKGMRDLGFLTIQGYGLTECAPIAALNRDTYYHDGSAGMATPNTLLDIYNVQDDGTGEIRFQGANVMLGYYRDPELTAQTLRDGWLYTGDLGYMDENGFLFITGRKKNVIVTMGGKNIFPEELEAHLVRSPYVKEAVVVGYVNHKRKDYDVVAIIHPDYEQLRKALEGEPTAERIDLELSRVVSGVNGTVQAYKRIQRFLISECEFPKNTTRKIKRQGIAAQFEAAYYNKK